MNDNSCNGYLATVPNGTLCSSASTGNMFHMLHMFDMAKLQSCDLLDSSSAHCTDYRQRSPRKLTAAARLPFKTPPHGCSPTTQSCMVEPLLPSSMVAVATLGLQRVHCCRCTLQQGGAASACFFLHPACTVATRLEHNTLSGLCVKRTSSSCTKT